MEDEIRNSALPAGCSDYLFLWEMYPERFAQALMVAAKRYARFIKESGLVKSHSKALETIAKAAGFEHWHAFHTVVQGLVNTDVADVDLPRPERCDQGSIKPLIHAFVFLVQATPDCPPTPDVQDGLQKAAAQIAQACGSPIEPVLDMIGRMNDADTWDKLLTRKPEQTTRPLYGFHVDDFDGRGEFVFSTACYALIEQQDQMFEGLNSNTPLQQRDFEAQLDHVLDAQPNFLEGLLAKAKLLDYKPELRRQQGKIYNEAISKAECLIPKGFKGSISWYSITNRFYHRLLYGAMVWHSHQGHTSKAIAIARRQLRLNNSDNLGVRMWLPVLLVADGQAQAADKAIIKMTPNGNTNAGIELVNAICHFANGRLQQSAESLYLAVFMYPPARHVISADWEALVNAANDRQARRIISHDPETMVNQYVSATMRLEEIEQSFAQWLEHPAVAIAEKALEREFHANWRRPNATLDKWNADVKEFATFLSMAATK